MPLPVIRLHLRMQRRDDAREALAALEVACAAAYMPQRVDYAQRLAERLEAMRTA
jgi:hypothetical protein